MRVGLVEDDVLMLVRLKEYVSNEGFEPVELSSFDLGTYSDCLVNPLQCLVVDLFQKGSRLRCKDIFEFSSFLPVRPSVIFFDGSDDTGSKKSLRNLRLSFYMGRNDPAGQRTKPIRASLQFILKKQREHRHDTGRGSLVGPIGRCR